MSMSVRIPNSFELIVRGILILATLLHLCWTL